MAVVDAIVALLGGLAPFAWPILIASLAFLFRKEFSSLVARIKGAKIAGGELLFEAGLALAEHNLPPDSGAPTSAPHPADHGHSTQDQGVEPSTYDRRYLMQLAEISPCSSVSLAFRYLEEELARAVDDVRPPQISRAIRALEAIGRLSAKDVKAIAELRTLRNMAVHGTARADLDYGEVVRYLRLTEDMIARLAPREIRIEKNSLTGGNFPPGGPWARDGKPELSDGDYKIVRYADRTWRLKDRPDVVVFRPVFKYPESG